jgi:SMI1 / KNR4 family (SUKH-1)
VDSLIERLRERAADPERRVDARETQFFAGVKTLDLGGLLGMLGDLRPLLERAVDGARTGDVDPEVAAKADEFAEAMSTPVESELPPPATLEELERAEEALGFALPPLLRRVYGEVANGGFGPGYGLVPLERMAAEYAELRQVMPGTGHDWPPELLPVVHHDPDWDCVDASTGGVVAFYWEEVDEDIDRAQFERAFHDLAPTLEAWLDDWVATPKPGEREAAL